MDIPVWLLVGLGNPGSSYEGTRHNIGFAILKEFAAKNSCSFKNVPSVSGELAQGQVHGKKTLMLLPMTYMNMSGHAVRQCADYFKVPHEQTFIICDDIALPFGSMRLKTEGSAGGHNGLKSVEAHLGTQSYPRLRIGVGDRLDGDLEDHVLGRFSQEESAAIPKVVEKAIKALDLLLVLGVVEAMRHANAKIVEIPGE